MKEQNKYMSAIEAGKKWGVGRRTVTVLCSEGRVPGAQLVGNSWVIPADAEKPADARIKSGKYIKGKTIEAALVNLPSNLSDGFKSLLVNPELNVQVYDLLPIPIEIFAADGTVIYANRAGFEMVGITDPSKHIGIFNLWKDSECIRLMGQDVLDKIFHGEAVSFPDFPAPIQDVYDRGVINEKPWDAATMDLFFLPIWDGDVFNCTICFFTVKNMYKGRTDIIKAQEYIEQNWLEEFNIEKAARAANLSLRHFQRIFKENAKMTPFEYYKKIKIEKLKEKLLDLNLNIEQAFAACGVDYHGHYKSMFKDTVGMSPSEYRKERIKIY